MWFECHEGAPGTARTTLGRQQVDRTVPVRSLWHTCSRQPFEWQPLRKGLAIPIVRGRMVLNPLVIVGFPKRELNVVRMP